MCLINYVCRRLDVLINGMVDRRRVWALGARNEALGTRRAAVRLVMLTRVLLVNSEAHSTYRLLCVIST